LVKIALSDLQEDFRKLRFIDEVCRLLGRKPSSATQVAFRPIQHLRVDTERIDVDLAQ
jgi:hypothetical protein